MNLYDISTELLDKYLSGGVILRHNISFTIIDNISKSETQKKVLNGLIDTSYGHCISYSDFASKIGLSSQVRNIATLIGKNMLPVIIPCHRITRKDGSIGQYIFGTKVKKELIDFESKKIAKISNESIEIVKDFFYKNYHK